MITDQLQQTIQNKGAFVLCAFPGQQTIHAVLDPFPQAFQQTNFTDEGFYFAPFTQKAQHPIIFLRGKLQAIQELGNQLTGDFGLRASLDLTQQQFEQHVQQMINAIHADTFAKAVAFRVKHFAERLNPLKAFKKCVKAYQSAFVYLFFHPETGLWLGATPETLIQQEEDKVSTMSLAGTQPITDSAPKWSVKEIEEQAIVTKFIERELSKVSDEVQVSGAVNRQAGKLWHLCSTISAKGVQLNKAVEQLHPTPATGGFPKLPALQWLQAKEPIDRQYYAGFLGYVQSNKANFYVNLRSARLFNNGAEIFVGCGITKDSNPTEEWQETENKAHTMLDVLVE